jgi:hypothetical protein
MAMNMGARDDVARRRIADRGGVVGFVASATTAEQSTSLWIVSSVSETISFLIRRLMTQNGHYG